MSALTASERRHEAFYRKMEEEGVVIDYDPPPIPSRAYDYVAVRDTYEPGDPIGRGSTAEEAYLDLTQEESIK
jgi:hypothetical protein